jgi:hypothetical protein
MRLGDNDFTRSPLEPTLVPFCVQCGTSMWLIQIEDFPGRSRRTYHCPDCLHDTTIMMDYGLNMRECIPAEVD